MGAFTIFAADDQAALRAADLARFDYPQGRVLDAGPWRVAVHPRRTEVTPGIHPLPGGGFVALAGTLLYRGARDAEALPLLFGGAGSPALGDAHGHFALAIFHEDVLRVVTDRMSAFRVFVAPGQRAVSTSFLALASMLKKPSFDIQAVHEFVLSGAVLGDASLLTDIQTLPLGGAAEFSLDGVRITQSPPNLPTTSRKSRQALLDEASAQLDRSFGAIADTSPSLCCALTAGYDSRLIVAQLRRRGAIPRMIVYGGNDPNTQIAREIALGEGLALDVIDPQASIVPLEAFKDVARRNFLHIDGYHHDGIFISDLEIRERAARTRNGTIYLHGGAGEIFRNFFQLPDGPRRARDVVQAMYGKYDRRTCAAGFDAGAFAAGIERKIQATVGSDARRLDRATIEWLYPNFRCRAWFGRESSLNNVVGASLMPFYERDITDFAATIPLRFKNHGCFQAALIAAADAKLASYRSQYGHPFVGPVPARRRLSDTLKTSLPPAVRPWLYGLRERHRQHPASPYLRDDYVRAAMGDEIHPILRRFNLSAMGEPRLKSRALTVAYLAAWLGV